METIYYRSIYHLGNGVVKKVYYKVCSRLDQCECVGDPDIGHIHHIYTVYTERTDTKLILMLGCTLQINGTVPVTTLWKGRSEARSHRKSDVPLRVPGDSINQRLLFFTNRKV